MSGTVAVSWGRYGGFYVTPRVRICLGWVALTYVAGVEIDDMMRAYADEPKLRRKLANAGKWTFLHQRKSVRLRQQIAGDQRYIDALKAHLDAATITAVREGMKNARRGAALSPDLIRDHGDEDDAA